MSDQEISVTIDNLFAEFNKKNQAILDHCHHSLNSIRTGAVTTNIVDPVNVTIHNNAMKIEHIASISIRDSSTLIIKPWDSNNKDAIVRAINMANLNMGVSAEADSIKLTMPPMSQERRLELVKLAKEYTESGRVATRNARRDIIEKFKKLEKNKKISKDECKKYCSDVDTSCNDFIQKLNEILKEKEEKLLKN